VTSENKNKRMNTKFVTSHHTKASTFAIPAKATRKAKIAKELAFLSTRMARLVQLDKVLKTHPKKIKTPNAPSTSIER